mgnify:CR=1 FL=1
MKGLIGIEGKENARFADEMLSKIQHRGKYGKIVKMTDDFILGAAANEKGLIIREDKGTLTYSTTDREDSVKISARDKKIIVKRDKFGVEPLYYTYLPGDRLAIASEIKSLVQFNGDIKELLPGHILEEGTQKKYFELSKSPILQWSQRELSRLLKDTLGNAITGRIKKGKMGAWLSGGLDSSVISAILRKNVDELHTFSVGFLNAPDLRYARIAADYIRSNHHERIISFENLMETLPKVIYHLESFDPLLVRSSIMNYFVSELASEYVDEVFSGEGGDELFAGYLYIKEMPRDLVEDELIDITKRLHNTALQRVDRCSSAFGVTAHVPFLDEKVVDLAVRIPVDHKIYDKMEKWILRLALVDDLPNDVLMRTKSKFWEGSGIGEHFFSYAEGLVSDSDFENEREIKCGWKLSSKEELMYYRVFREHFGELEDLEWMGRSKSIAEMVEE